MAMRPRLKSLGSEGTRPSGACMTLWKLGEAAADELDDRRRERLGEARAGSCASRRVLRVSQMPRSAPNHHVALFSTACSEGAASWQRCISRAPLNPAVNPSTGPERPLQRAGRRVPPPPTCSQLGISCKRSRARAKVSYSRRCGPQRCALPLPRARPAEQCHAYGKSLRSLAGCSCKESQPAAVGLLRIDRPCACQEVDDSKEFRRRTWTF